MSSLNSLINDFPIKNIRKAKLLKKMEEYPKTIGEMKLLISIYDKLNLFKFYDTSLIINMDSDRLNIIFAILKITNKLYNGYIENSIKNIFCKEINKIVKNKKSEEYEMFIDQYSQDTDYFINEIMKTSYPGLNSIIITNKFIKFITNIFDNSFYREISETLINGDLTDLRFTEMINTFISYTEETISKSYDTMLIFLNNIFDLETPREYIREILNNLGKNINLKKLIMDECYEKNIYVEQKLNSLGKIIECPKDDILINLHNDYINLLKLNRKDNTKNTSTICSSY
jgi:hypothetical protein